MAEIRKFFTEAEEQQVVEAIQKAELHTSGEIRVHIEEHNDKDAYDRAVEVFTALKMHKTKEHNGVLFYIATEDHQFAILGDKGINEKVPDNFWGDIKNSIQAHFKHGDFVTGLSEGILTSGKALSKFFPYEGEDDVNELSDDISTSI